MKKRFVNVAVCQRAATGATSEENTADSMEMIERAAGMAPDLDVVLLPECNNFIASPARIQTQWLIWQRNCMSTLFLGA